jgi:hypothetical protein
MAVNVSGGRFMTIAVKLVILKMLPEVKLMMLTLVDSWFELVGAGGGGTPGQLSSFMIIPHKVKGLAQG